MEKCRQKCAKPVKLVTTKQPRFYISRKLLEQSRQWMLTALAYGTALALGVSYITEWKTVLQYMPYYNLVYKEEVDVSLGTTEKIYTPDQGTGNGVDNSSTENGKDVGSSKDDGINENQPNKKDGTDRTNENQFNEEER